MGSEAGCGEHLRWVVLEPTLVFAWACVRCGHVGLFRAPGEDRSPARDAPVPVPVPVDAVDTAPGVIDWVAGFPRRVAPDPGILVYAPAGLRVADAAEARAAADAAVQAQAALPVLARLRAAGLPVGPPPPGLPPDLHAFVDVQEAAAAADRADLDELVALSARLRMGRPPTSPARRVAEEAVAVSPEAVERISAQMRHPDRDRRLQAFDAAAALAPLLPGLLAALVDVLRSPDGRDHNELWRATGAAAAFADELLAPHADVFRGLARRVAGGRWMRVDADARAAARYLHDAAEHLAARASAGRR